MVFSRYTVKCSSPLRSPAGTVGASSQHVPGSSGASAMLRRGLSSGARQEWCGEAARLTVPPHVSVPIEAQIAVGRKVFLHPTPEQEDVPPAQRGRAGWQRPPVASGTVLPTQPALGQSRGAVRTPPANPIPGVGAAGLHARAVTRAAPHGLTSRHCPASQRRRDGTVLTVS